MDFNNQIVTTEKGKMTLSDFEQETYNRGYFDGKKRCSYEEYIRVTNDALFSLGKQVEDKLNESENEIEQEVLCWVKDRIWDCVL